MKEYGLVPDGWQGGFLLFSVCGGSVLKGSKAIDFEKDLSLIDPSELPHSANFQLIFEGRLKGYQNRVMNEGVRVPYPIVPFENDSVSSDLASAPWKINGVEVI